MAALLPIPEDFDDRPFRVGDALERGVSPGRVRGADLEAPLWGVRTRQPIMSRLEFLRAAAERLSDGQALGGSAAAAVRGLPLPKRLQRVDAPVVVAAKRGGTVPRADGFVGVRVLPEKFATEQLDGFTVTDSALTWCLLSRELELRDLIAAGDILVSTSTRTDRRGPEVPVEVLAAAVEAWSGAPGAVILRTALGRLRNGVESPMESHLRSIIVEAGLPEPTVQPPVMLRDGRCWHPDLGYIDLKIGFEYEGAGHADPERMRRDIERVEAFAEVGWIIIRVTVDDLYPSSDVLVRRIVAAIEQRSASA